MTNQSSDLCTKYSIHLTIDTSSVGQQCNFPIDTCNQVEADVRIIVHIIDAIQSGCDNVTVRTVASDIMI